MSYRISSSVCALCFGLSLFSSTAFATPSAPTSSYKVLANQESGLNLETIQGYLNKGDEFHRNGSVEKAIEQYKKARKLANLLAPYFRDLNGAFRGLNASIPKEMNSKGRSALNLLSQANLRLAAIHRSRDEPNLAVPLLVDVVKLMTPTKPEGQKAYQALLELGFVETPYSKPF